MNGEADGILLVWLARREKPTMRLPTNLGREID